MKRWWPVIGALGGGVLGFAIAWALASDDIGKAGDWRGGAERFVGFAAVAGLAVGYVVVRQVAGRAPVTRDGFTLAYASIKPKPDGYRELTTARVADLLAALQAVGYAPTAQACDDTGEPTGPIAPERRSPG